jgi:hypothetical protein
VIPYSLTIYTGDIAKGGTDSNATIKVFGTKGTSDDIIIEKIENRFDRAAVDTLMVTFLSFFNHLIFQINRHFIHNFNNI